MAPSPKFELRQTVSAPGYAGDRVRGYQILLRNDGSSTLAAGSALAKIHNYDGTVVSHRTKNETPLEPGELTGFSALNEDSVCHTIEYDGYELADGSKIPMKVTLHHERASWWKKLFSGQRGEWLVEQ